MLTRMALNSRLYGINSVGVFRPKIRLIQCHSTLPPFFRAKIHCVPGNYS
jgi:hypothetical protein